MKQSTNQYCLEVHLKNQPPMKIDIIDSISVGLDPRNDLVLVNNSKANNNKINNRHLIFEKKEENLALHYLGNNNQTLLNGLCLEENRTYILEASDRIELGDTKIIIECGLRSVDEIEKKIPLVHNSSIDKNSDLKNSEFNYCPPLFTPLEKTSPTPPEYGQLVALWIIKFHSLILDAFITYTALVVLIPLLSLEQFSLNIFNYFSALIFPNRTHSFFSFFISWYFLSFSQTIIFGCTLGQWILGLKSHPKKTFAGLVLLRIKIFIYSLFLLPAQNTVKNSLFARGMRNFGVIIVLFFILISPFLLPTPYNANITLLGNDPLKIKELHTRTISSYSKDLGMYLAAELPFRYYLLPAIVNANKRAFELVDLKTGENIIISETDNQSYEKIEAQLKYGNPFYSILNKSPLTQASFKEKKMMIQNILLLSPFQIIHNIKALGPFFGSALFIKKNLMNSDFRNDMFLKTYRPQSPLFYFSSSQQDFFYLLGPEHIRRFVAPSENKSKLLSIFEQAIFTKLTQDSQNSIKLSSQTITILEAQDAFLHGDEQTFLTYYVAIANSLASTRIVHAEVDFTNQAKLAVIKNIENVLKFIKNKNISKALYTIKSELAPMEKPGEKR